MFFTSGTFTLLVVLLSSFIQFTSCQNPDAGNTNASPASSTDATNTANSATTSAKTGSNGCTLKRFIDPVLQWFVKLRKAVWDTMLKAKESIVSLYRKPVSTTNKVEEKTV